MSTAASGSVLLVSMPWTTLRAPSIQIGTVKAVLDGAAIPTKTAHLYVSFFDYVTNRLDPRFRDVDEFEQCGWLFGEWAFTVPPFRMQSETSDERFRLRFRREFGDRMIDSAFAVRRLVPAFLEHCADELLEHGPSAVGFSSTFAQTVPSLVLAKVLKQRDPRLKIVLGGSNLEGPMGEAVHRLYPWVDVVARGEAEDVAPTLFRELVAGSKVTAQPGLCVRDGDRVEVTREDRPRARMGKVPLPSYEEYFDRVAGTPLEHAKLWLPYETSRGCWWGVKHLCTFCAANGASVTFRSKPPDVVLDQLDELPRRYGVRDVWFVDNILDERYLRDVFPALRDQRQKLSIFVETKAHLARGKLEMLRDAGVVMAQVGVESLSTPVLMLMDKGTTAVQNVRTLKWCAELGIKTFWNIIYGFPGESPENYRQMAELVPSLIHLPPPNLPIALRLDRFSPYHSDPDRYGIEITGPLPINRFVHAGAPSDVMQLQYFFSFRYRDGRTPDDYVTPLLKACERWRRDTEHNFGALSYRVDGGIVTVSDRRTDREPINRTLSPLYSRIFLGCDSGASVERLWRSMEPDERGSYTREDLETVLEELVARRWMMKDGGTYLSLAMLTSRSRERRPVSLPALDSLSDARTVVGSVRRG